MIASAVRIEEAAGTGEYFGEVSYYWFSILFSNGDVGTGTSTPGCRHNSLHACLAPHQACLPSLPLVCFAFAG